MKAYKKPKFAIASENESAHSYPVVLQHFARNAAQYGVHGLCELLCLLLIFKSTYLVSIWCISRLWHVKPGHGADYFLPREKSPGSWGGGGCISKQPFYFQRSLEKCIFCYYQAFVNFAEDTSIFLQCIYLFLWQRDDFALSWTKLNRGCSMLLFCLFLWGLFSAQWGGSGMWFTKSCLISLHIHMHVHILFCGEVLLCLPELLHCACKRRGRE